MKVLDDFYFGFEEPVRSCLLGLRDLLLSLEKDLEPAWKYGGAFFCYKGKNICYLWVEKKTQLPYIGWVYGNKLQHPALESGDRTQVKILKIDPESDFPVRIIKEIVTEAVDLYR